MQGSGPVQVGSRNMPSRKVCGRLAAIGGWVAVAAITAAAVSVFGPSGASAQQAAREKTDRAVAAAKRNNPRLQVQIDPETGLLTSVKGLSPNANLGAARSIARPTELTDEARDAAARRAAEAFFAQGELSAAVSARNADTRVEALKVRPDPDFKDQRIVAVEQRVNGVPVFGSTGKVVVSPSLGVTQMTAKLSAVAVDKTAPTLSREAAIAIGRDKLAELIDNRGQPRALMQLRTGLAAAEAKAETVVFDPALLRSRGAATGPARLAWLVSVDTFRLFVDAENGQILFFFRDHPSASAAPRQVYDLGAATVFPGKKIIDDGANLKPDTLPAGSLPADADLAYRHTGSVDEFLAQVLGRKGIADSEPSKTLESYVRYGDVENAYWCKDPGSYCPKSGVMVYGPNFASALDVVGHEMTHGVITHEADLIYSDESGAVNEALSDIFGVLIEYQASNGNGNWVIGEKLPGFSLTSPLRSLANPHMQDADGASKFDKDKPYGADNMGQPDHYSEYVKREHKLCDTTNDYFSGCVHFNSGILNKFAYLVSEGGRHYGTDVNGLGRQKLARIAYRALTTQLHPNSGLVEAADGFLQACRDLSAQENALVQPDDCKQVEAAGKATGLVAGTS